MSNITGEQVKEAVLATGITRVDHHECGFCQVMVHYVIKGENLFFDSSCNCTTLFSDLQPREWDYAANWINTNEGENRKKIAALFGLDLEVADVHVGKGDET